jgi:hypothetical protein
MIKGTIEVTGKTLDDVLDAIDEARKRIADEFTSGFDRKEDGSFQFELKERVARTPLQHGQFVYGLDGSGGQWHSAGAS